MIYVICGLIGAGKTTYAKENFEYYTDFDELDSKIIQIEKTWEYHQKGLKVAHITCYPTSEETAFFDSVRQDEIRYFWVNTTEKQCERNIKKRGRKRDLLNLIDVLLSNSELVKTVQKSSIPFEFIDVFPTDERW